VTGKTAPLKEPAIFKLFRGRWTLNTLREGIGCHDRGEDVLLVVETQRELASLNWHRRWNTHSTAQHSVLSRRIRRDGHGHHVVCKPEIALVDELAQRIEAELFVTYIGIESGRRRSSKTLVALRKG